MKTRRTLAAAAAAGVAAGVLGLGIAFAALSSSASFEAQARAVAGEFFQTINSRRFARTCDLMSARFYREKHVSDKKRCVLGLTVGFAMSPAVRFRILSVRAEGDRAVVKALANGLPGEIVLVKESGHVKVLSLDGS